jgi:hypothetical protein
VFFSTVDGGRSRVELSEESEGLLTGRLGRFRLLHPEGQSQGLVSEQGEGGGRRLRGNGDFFGEGSHSEACQQGSLNCDMVNIEQPCHVKAPKLQPNPYTVQSEQGNEYFLHHRRSGRDPCDRKLSRTARLKHFLARR